MSNFDLAADHAFKNMLDASTEAQKLSSTKPPKPDILSPQALYTRALSYIDVYVKLLMTHRAILSPREVTFHIDNYKSLIELRNKVAKYNYAKTHLLEFIEFKNQCKKSARVLMITSEQCRVDYMEKEATEMLCAANRPSLTGSAFASLSEVIARCGYTPSAPTEGESTVNCGQTDHASNISHICTP